MRSDDTCVSPPVPRWASGTAGFFHAADQHSGYARPRGKHAPAVERVLLLPGSNSDEDEEEVSSAFSRGRGGGAGCSCAQELLELKGLVTRLVAELGVERARVDALESKLDAFTIAQQASSSSSAGAGSQAEPKATGALKSS